MFVSINSKLHEWRCPRVGNQPDRFVTIAINGGGQGNWNISNNGSAANRIRNIDGVVTRPASSEQRRYRYDQQTTSFTRTRRRRAGITTASIPVVASTDAGLYRQLSSGNDVQGNDGPDIYAIARNSAGTLNVTIANNTCRRSNTTTCCARGIRVDSARPREIPPSWSTFTQQHSRSTNTATSLTSARINLCASREPTPR